MTAINTYGFFKDSTSGLGKTALADVVFNGYTVRKSDLAVITTHTNLAATELGIGLYGKNFDIDTSLYDVVGVFSTASAAVSEKVSPAVRWDGAERWSTELARIDATITSRLALASYTAPDNASIATLLARVIGTLAAGTHQPQSGDAYTVAGLIKIVTDKLATMLQTIGLNWQFTTEALWLAPTGDANISDTDKTDIAQRAWDSDYVQERTLSVSGENIVDSVLADNNISAHRGDTMILPITGLGSLAADDILVFTVKELKDLSADDTQARIQIQEAQGLLIFNRAAPVDATDGDLTVDDRTDGDITISLIAARMAELPAQKYRYDIQRFKANGQVDTRRQGYFTVNEDVTRRVEVIA